MSIALEKPLRELRVVLDRHEHAFDEPKTVQLVAHVRAAGLLTETEWQQILVWLDEAMGYLAGTASGGTADDAYEDEQGDWSPEDDKDEGEEEIDCIDSPDADPRNADWIRIVSARRRSGHVLPSWAGLWLWWLGHNREFDAWWGPIGKVANSLGTQPFDPNL
jgi:hypothetical protein